MIQPPLVIGRHGRRRKSDRPTFVDLHKPIALFQSHSRFLVAQM